MFTAQFFGSWLAYVAITFVMGFVWHLVMFKDLYRRLAIYSRLDDPIVPLGLAAMIIQGAILAGLYPHVVHDGHSALTGIVFGLVMGAFIASSAVFAEAAKQRVTSLPTWLAVETVYYVIQFSLAGLAIGLVHGAAAR